MAAERERILNKIAIKLRDYEPKNGIPSKEEISKSFDDLHQHAQVFQRFYTTADGSTPKRVLSRTTLHEDAKYDEWTSHMMDVKSHEQNLQGGIHLRQNDNSLSNEEPNSLRSIQPPLNWNSWDGSSSSDGSHQGRFVEEERGLVGMTAEDLKGSIGGSSVRLHHNNRLQTRRDDSDDGLHHVEYDYQPDMMSTSTIFSDTMGGRRPPHSYSALIEMAIRRMPDQKCTLKHIYNWIQNNFEYYQQSKKNWKNAVRHNLSVNDCFIRTTKDNKTNYWTFNPQKIDQLPSVRKRKSLMKRMPIGRTIDAGMHYHHPSKGSLTQSELQNFRPEHNTNMPIVEHPQESEECETHSFPSLSETTSGQSIISDMFSDAISHDLESSNLSSTDETRYDHGLFAMNSSYPEIESYSLDMDGLMDLSVEALPTIPEETINDGDWSQFLKL